MRKKRNYVLFACCSLAMLTGSMQIAFGQEEPPPSTCLPTDPDYDPRLCVPIDGGLAFLLAAGVGYGILRNRNGQKKTEQNKPDSQIE